MSVIPGGFAPLTEDLPVLVERELFEEMVAALAEKNGKPVEIGEYRNFRGTISYSEATIYEIEPHPDPLTVER